MVQFLFKTFQPNPFVTEGKLPLWISADALLTIAFKIQKVARPYHLKKTLDVDLVTGEVTQELPPSN